MRILAINSCVHDASAAAFDEYELVAAVAEERLNRKKGFGGELPWRAVDEVLGAAGWSRTASRQATSQDPTSHNPSRPSSRG